MRRDTKQVIVYFIMLSFLLPYDFVSNSLNNIIGTIFNEYFFAGFPLYVFLPFSFKYKRSRGGLDKLQRLVLIFTITILFFTNILPGLSKLIGLGGYNIRLAYLFNFINGIIISYYFMIIKPEISFIKKILKYIIFFGFILSITGIIQYFLKISIIPNFNPDSFDRLFIFIFISPVDCLPFLLVPFVFSCVFLLKNEKFDLKLFIAFITIWIAILLTWSRWGVAISFIVFLFIILTLVKNKANFILIAITIGVLIILLLNNLNSQISSRGQGDRLNSNSNLIVRVYLWGLGLSAIYESPIWGYGFGDHSDEMFIGEAKFFFLDETSKFNMTNVNHQSVHQFLIDYCLSLGVLFLIPLFIMLFSTLKYTIRSHSKKKYLFYEVELSIFYATLAIIIFGMQNQIGPFYFFFIFFSIVNLLSKLKLELT